MRWKDELPQATSGPAFTPGGEPAVLPRHVHDPGDVLGLVGNRGTQGIVQQSEGGGETRRLSQAPSLQEATGGARPGNRGGQQVLHSSGWSTTSATGLKLST